jgi:hypothetical protein
MYSFPRFSHFRKNRKNGRRIPVLTHKWLLIECKVVNNVKPRGSERTMTDKFYYFCN